jgi:hypothetical protein
MAFEWCPYYGLLNGVRIHSYSFIVGVLNLILNEKARFLLWSHQK